MVRLFIFFLLLPLQSFVQGCSRTPPSLHFPEHIALQSRELTVGDIPMRYPFRVQLADSLLYIMDLHATDHYIHTFTYPAMTYQSSLMPRGEAPNEFLGAENIRIDPQGDLWSLDANHKKIVRLKIESDTVSTYTIDLDQDLIRTLDFCLVDDSTFIVPDYTGEHRIAWVDHRGCIIRRAFHIPMLESDGAPSIALAQAWRPFMDYHAGHKRLAVVTQLGQVLEIYDTDQERVVSIVCPKGGQPRFSLADGHAIPTGIMGYSAVQIGAKHIYALYWGHSFDDLKAGKITQEGGQYLHVFDLEGKPIRQYTLDRHLTGFFIDEDNKRMIGLDVNSNQPIVEYNF